MNRNYQTERVNDRNLLDFFASTHSSYLHAKGKLATALLASRLNARPGDKILEIGVGTGATHVDLLNTFGASDFFGVDVSSEMIATARKRLAFCGFGKLAKLYKLEDGRKLPFENSFFDIVFAESVLGIQEGDSPAICLREIYRVLKPGGKLILNETVWLPGISLESIKKFNKFCKQKFGIIQANDHYPYPDDWLQLVADIGFTEVSMDAVDQNTENHSRVLRNNRRSTLFDLFGKIKGGMLFELKAAKRDFEASMREANPNGSQLMEGFIFAALKPVV